MKKLPLNKPKAIIFDWDSTLVDNWDCINAAMNAALRALGHPPISREENIGRTRKPAIESFSELFGEDWEKGRGLFYEGMKNIDTLQGIKILPGTVEMLEGIKNLHIPIGVVSNKKGVLVRREVEHLGWQNYFFAVVGSGDAAFDKPHPAPILYALKTRMIPPGPDVWMIGDMESDIEAAERAGVSGILIETTASLGLGIEGTFEIYKPVSRVFDAKAFLKLAEDTIDTILVESNRPVEDRFQCPKP